MRVLRIGSESRRVRERAGPDGFEGIGGLSVSALEELVVAERGSTALRRWLEARDDLVFLSDLMRTELLRATRRVAPERTVQARAVLDALVLLTLSSAICERAGLLAPANLRSLEALHLAAAQEMGDELAGIVTYDRQLTDGAEALGYRVIAPT